MTLSSNDVFALRKQGEIGQAFAIAQQLIAEKPTDEWNQRAYVYCVIDLIKQAAAANDHAAVAGYFSALENVTIPNDEILQKSLNSVRALTSIAAPFIKQAKQASDENDHNKAINLLKQALQLTPADISLRTNLGWALYKQAKLLLQVAPVNVFAIKRLLNDYLQLNTEKPSLLHSSMLRIADGLSKEASFDLPAFLMLWGFGHFQQQDFDPYIQEETGNKFEPLAERVVFHALKQAVIKENTDFLTKLMPLLDKVIARSEDAIWLNFNKAKALLLLGQPESAYKLAIDVAKQKTGDYWMWELLGDINYYYQPEKVALFYGKALSIRAPEQYLVKLRLKLAQWFLAQQNFAAAKCELELIKRTADAGGGNVSRDCQELMQQPWYQATLASHSNDAFYKAAAAKVEEELYSNLPTYIAVISGSFAIKDKPHKKKLKLILHYPGYPEPIEATISESKVKSLKLSVGDCLAVKGEAEPNDNKRFKVLVVAGTDKQPEASLLKPFTERCTIANAGFAFTASGIFIDAGLVKNHHIQSECTVTGMAIKSYDRAKEKWGWKALRVTDVKSS